MQGTYIRSEGPRRTDSFHSPAATTVSGYPTSAGITDCAVFSGDDIDDDEYDDEYYDEYNADGPETKSRAVGE